MANVPTIKSAKRKHKYREDVDIDKKVARFVMRHRDHDKDIAVLPESLDDVFPAELGSVPPAKTTTRRRGTLSATIPSAPEVVAVYTNADPDLDKVVRDLESQRQVATGEQQQQQQREEDLPADPKDEVLIFDHDEQVAFFRDLFHQAMYWDTKLPMAKQASDIMRPVLETVHAAHIHTYLREPIGTDRPCAAGAACRARLLPHGLDAPITATEFLTESQHAAYMAQGAQTLPTTPGLCYICCLYMTQWCHLHTCRGGKLPTKTFGKFSVLHSQVGEYKLENCMQPKGGASEGILFPIRLFHIDEYDYVKEKHVTRNPASQSMHHTNGALVRGWIETDSVFF